MDIHTKHKAFLKEDLYDKDDNDDEGMIQTKQPVQSNLLMKSTTELKTTEPSALEQNKNQDSLSDHMKQALIQNFNQFNNLKKDILDNKKINNFIKYI